MSNDLDAAQVSQIHLLDVGLDEYGDALLCQFGKRSVLIDGAHPGDDDGSTGHDSIPEQLGKLLGTEEPYAIDLLIISHAHQDHIGCIPKLIADGRLQVGWALLTDPGLGWGRAPGDVDALDQLDEQTRTLTAALREEIHTPRGTDDAALERILTDAVTLETRYKRMIDDLNDQGTKVVRFGRDDAKPLLDEFKGIGLKIIGPSKEHLVMCADIIHNKTQDSIRMVSDFLARDNPPDLVSAYRSITVSERDSVTGQEHFIDAKTRPGPAINLQSIITQFAFGGHKFLFAGDFQFARLEVSSDELEKSVTNLRKAIKKEAPYSFVKLSHHGSDNAFSDFILEDLKDTKYLGICAGEQSSHHPHRDVLELLKDHTDDLNWARTDHNKQVTFTFKKGTAKPQIKLSKGKLNDAKPNDFDVTVTAGPVVTAPPPPQLPPQTSVTKIISAAPVGPPSKDIVEVFAKIPVSGARIRFSGEFTVEVDSGSAPNSGVRIEPQPRTDAGFVIGGGRALLKDLLFVTSKEALRENIGTAETDTVLAAFSNQGLKLLADLPPKQTTSSQSAKIVQDVLKNDSGIKGVVIIGGYDVVPAQFLDCLPVDLRASLPSNDDPDNFIVWNDEVYGDNDDDGLAELPVSRIPDGKSASLLFKALQAGAGVPAQGRFGIRNIARPFADGIFRDLVGADNLLVSRKTVFDEITPDAISGDKIYFMLHGDYVDGSRFWGEGTPLNREAFNIGNLPEKFTGVVFTGCCWGALTVDTPAGLSLPNRPFGQKTSASSLALAFLERGALAFVGCTGAHYSPTDAPFNYFGGPMHAAFWRHYHAGQSPAVALFNAKIEYLNEMPHGRTGALQRAIEFKILRQYTCLGLGW